MTTYYVDPAAAGSNNGSSWTNAWTSLQSAADTAVAGDIVYCRGEQMIAAKIDFDTNAGTNAAGAIKFIGCNASGNVDGTRFILNAGGNSGRHCIDASSGTADFVWMENIECKNSTGTAHGFYGASSSDGWVFVNCCANTCGAYGFTGFRYAIFYRCVAYSNGSDGWNSSSAILLLCASRDNSGSGLYQMSSTVIYGCVLHNNSDDGYEAMSQTPAASLINCVIDGNADDGVVLGAHTDARGPLIFGCRITNHSGSGDIGLNCNSEPCITGFNYFEDNDGNNIQNDTLHYFLPIEGGSTTSNQEDQADTDEGYVDRANNDFSTRYVDGTDPTLRRTAITVPWS